MDDIQDYSVKRRRVETRSSSSTTSEDPFPFFHLLPELIHHIVRNYVSVADKYKILKNIPQFISYLSPRSVWFTSTCRLHVLAFNFPPGWYQMDSDLDYLFYVSVDYNHLTLCIYFFTTESRSKKEPREISKLTSPFKEVYKDIASFRSDQGLTHIDEPHVLTFEYFSCSTRRMLRFWVYDRAVVTWLETDDYVPLVQNKCSLVSTREDLKLTLQEDRSLRVSSVCRQRGYRMKKVIFPCSFEICRETSFLQGESKRCDCCPVSLSSLRPFKRTVYHIYPEPKEITITEAFFYNDQSEVEDEDD